MVPKVYVGLGVWGMSGLSDPPPPPRGTLNQREALWPSATIQEGPYILLLWN